MDAEIDTGSKWDTSGSPEGVLSTIGPYGAEKDREGIPLLPGPGIPKSWAWRPPLLLSKENPCKKEDNAQKETRAMIGECPIAESSFLGPELLHGTS